MIYIPRNWLDILADEFNKDYFKTLQNFLSQEYSSTIVFPQNEKIFNAFLQTKFSDIKVVILGQDPYINDHQAHGLCFSVERGALPPSLCNIFKELKNEYGHDLPTHGNLTNWAKQGVLLLNTILTVRRGESLSHKDKGWEIFTRAVIEKIAAKLTPIVFILWGRNAQKAVEGIDLSRHCVLSSAHPSPFSAHNGFFGNGHFKKCNDFLTSHGLTPIDWKI